MGGLQVIWKQKVFCWFAENSSLLICVDTELALLDRVEIELYFALVILSLLRDRERANDGQYGTVDHEKKNIF
jgi:hypothetical protein